MKKKIALVAATVAVLAIGIPAMALAQNQGANDTIIRPRKGSIDIIAPSVAPVNQQVQMTVFYSVNQTPVEGAGVWAVSADRVEAVKQEMAKIKDKASDGGAAATEQIMALHSAFLARTGPEGRIVYTFAKEGKYLLVAFKPGLWPDLRPIDIGVRPTGRPALAIDAPGRAAPGERFGVTVTEKATQDPAKDAQVWALTREKADAVRAGIEALKSNAADATVAAEIENTLNARAIFLGKTNGAGKLEPQPSLDDAGTYVLVTFKPGYWPAWKTMLVASSAKILVIDAPNRARIDEKIAITVTERATGEAVKDAGVWALTREQAQSFKTDMDSLRKNASDRATIQARIEAALKASGIYLGTTNGAGKVEPQPSFHQGGTYLIVTYKSGYWPAWKPVSILNINMQTTRPGAGNAPETNAAITRRP